MIIVSSHRAHADSAEVSRNQIRANQSWQKVADKIVYLGPFERDLDGSQVCFVSAPDFPRIRTVAMVAATSGSHASIVNADIVLSPNTNSVISDVIRRGGQAAVSRRYEFVGDDVDGAQLLSEDQGLDFFFASSSLWLRLARTIPVDFRIGHSAWDTYTLSFFNTTARGSFYDLTNRRCVFHPRHGDRKRKYDITPIDDRFTLNPTLPRSKI